MSLEKILAELPSLNKEEREAVECRLYELSVEASRQWVKQWESREPLPPGYWTKVFEEWTGKGDEDLPEDFSINHDHYIHGAPKRW